MLEERKVSTGRTAQHANGKKAEDSKGNIVISREITEANAMFQAQLLQRIQAFGAAFGVDLDVGERLRQACPEMIFKEFNIDGLKFIISLGCHLFSDEHSLNRDEFIILSRDKENIFIWIIRYVCFFHATRRTILPGDLLEIGKIEGVASEYTHVYVAVPFFLPSSINRMHIADIWYNLSWLIPVNVKEASFIKEYGSERFEGKLFNSSFGYFGVRDNVSYLFDD